MMMNNTLRNQCNILPGSVITGKWNRNRYRILKELGYGANGIVYLAENGSRQVALKLSNNGTSIISEMNVLKSFSKVQGSALGPSFVEADDYIHYGKNLPFYVMEYIKGISFLDFISQKGNSWTGVLLLQLLTSLSALHKQGWVFGDLKPENLIITLPDVKVRCVDVGGTTLIGRSIKEFTEFFDRGYWGLGSRKADPAYDLFAAAMIMINTAYTTRFSKKGEGYTQLKELIKQKKELLPYQEFLEKALTGKYHTSHDMRNDLLAILSVSTSPTHSAKASKTSQPNPTKRTNSRNVHNQSPGRKTRSRTAMRRKASRTGGGLLETLLLVSVIFILYVLYIYGHLI
jgi:serine/threonine protein kinase